MDTRPYFFASRAFQRQKRGTGDEAKYYAIHITRQFTKTPTHEVCSAVRGMVESTLKTVTSHMNYSFCAEYQLSFECPAHPGRDHLCTVASDDTSSPHVMLCLGSNTTPTTKEKLLAMLGNPVTEVSSVDKPPGTIIYPYITIGEI